MVVGEREGELGADFAFVFVPRYAAKVHNCVLHNSGWNLQLEETNLIVAALYACGIKSYNQLTS
jgi:hypothetical protein